VTEETGRFPAGLFSSEPVNAPGPYKKLDLLRDPAQVSKVKTPSYVNCYMNGESREEVSLPGPFITLG
jgi:hypothetical protein